MNDLNILYEDNHIIVVVKPANVLSQSDSTKDIDMLTIIKNYIKEKYNKPGNVYLGLVHRLDRPVGGIMVFAKTSKAAKRLNETINNHEMIKEYILVCDGIIKGSGKFEDNLIQKKDKVVVDEFGKYSCLEYEVIKNMDNKSLVKVKLITGRKHQIRVQFASRNHSLYGDQRYGVLNKKQIALFAYHLSFKHPTKDEIMDFKYLPNGEIWEKFDIEGCGL